MNQYFIVAFAIFSDLEDLRPKNFKAKLVMFGDYDTDGSKTYVEDPYYVNQPRFNLSFLWGVGGCINLVPDVRIEVMLVANLDD